MTTTPCSIPECDTDGTGEPCDQHEIEQAHAEGEHELCGLTCEAKLPSEQLRNAILWSAIPGSANMLAELERRAAAAPPAPDDELRQAIADRVYPTYGQEDRNRSLAIADLLLPLVAARDAQTRREVRRQILAASLRGPADPHASETWTRGYRAGLSVAVDLTAARADGIHRGQA